MKTSSKYVIQDMTYPLIGLAVMISLLAGITPTAAFPIPLNPNTAPDADHETHTGFVVRPISVNVDTSALFDLHLTASRLPVESSALLGELDEVEVAFPVFSDLSDIFLSVIVPGTAIVSTVGIKWKESLFSWDTVNGVPVPEPGTLTLLVMAGGMLVITRWKQRLSGRTHVAATGLRLPDPDTQERDARLRQVGMMTSEILHDLKNVMSGIRTCGEVLGYDDLTAAERAEYQQLLDSELERGLVMMQDVLDFSAGREHLLRLEPHNLHDLLEEVAATLKRQWVGEPITIRTALHDTGMVRMDADKMKRVLLNLAVNARDAMHDGGELTLRSSRSGSAVRIEVCDTGCGMTPQLLARVFEPFVTEGKPNGTGLGLTITRTIVEGHHGHLDLRSTVGQGTTVYLTLPASTVS